MKTMTCKQLGGACDQEFQAETFEEMAILSQKHGLKMFQKRDKKHLRAMVKMEKLMGNDGAIQKWLEKKQAIFNALPEVES